MKSSGFFSLGKVLIAAVAICAAAPSAKADLVTLNLTTANPTPPPASETTTATFNLAFGPGTGTNVQVGDFTISYKVSETYANGTESLIFQVTSLTKGTSTVAGASTLIYSLTDSSVANPTAGGTLTNSLSGASFTGAGTGQKITANATYSDYVNGAGPSPATVSYTGGTTQPTSTHSTVSVNTPYTLATSGAVTHAANNSVTAFTATASIHGVPEPSAVIAALAGLPCMGLVLGFARRRRAIEQTAAAM